MTDVRSLLRQQRAARRINHPYASYSESGRLTCTLCSEPIKAESLWENHLRNSSHHQLSLKQRHISSTTKGSNTSIPSSTHQSHKRRHIDNSDDDNEKFDDLSIDLGNDARKKRTKTETTAAGGPLVASFIHGTPDTSTSIRPSSRSDSTNVINNPIASSIPSHKRELSSGSGSGSGSSVHPKSPPSLPRRTSSTPQLGVEMSIPSRPATPSSSSASTPKNGGIPAGRSPLIPQDSTATNTVMISRSASSSSARVLTSGPTLNGGARGQEYGIQKNKGATPYTVPAETQLQEDSAKHEGNSTGDVDEAEWAAFEADIAAVEEQQPPLQQAISADAVISAPALSAEQVVEYEEEKRRLREKEQKTIMESLIEGEKEDATRQLEEEFDEMQELEARVRRLKEKREALRRESTARKESGVLVSPTAGAVRAELVKAAGGLEGKENAIVEDDEDDEDDDDDDDDGNDDWMGFRFRT